MTFNNDLALGQYYEKKYIEKRGFSDIFYPHDKCFKDYDFKNNETGTKYEVKADKKASKTGNLFIESMCNGVNSGIIATKADYWIHFVCKNEKEPLQSEYFYKIPVEKLLSIVRKNGNYYCGAGDGKRVKGYLLKECNVEEYKRFYSI